MTRNSEVQDDVKHVVDPELDRNHGKTDNSLQGRKMPLVGNEEELQ